eukprot:6194107-Pleurochrysis_carterae.AAC.1
MPDCRLKVAAGTQCTDQSSLSRSNTPCKPYLGADARREHAGRTHVVLVVVIASSWEGSGEGLTYVLFTVRTRRYMNGSIGAVKDPPDSVLYRRYSSHAVVCCFYFIPIGYRHALPRCALAARTLGHSAVTLALVPSRNVSNQPARLCPTGSTS